MKHGECTGKQATPVWKQWKIKLKAVLDSNRVIWSTVDSSAGGEDQVLGIKTVAVGPLLCDKINGANKARIQEKNDSLLF